MIVWMATKSFIRDFSISFSSHLNKVRKAQIEELEKVCLSQLRELTKKFSKAVESELKSSRFKLHDLLRRKAEFIMQFSRIFILMCQDPASYWLYNSSAESTGAEGLQKGQMISL